MWMLINELNRFRSRERMKTDDCYILQEARLASAKLVIQ